ncbi:MAG TPA: hypothetical protein VIF09_15095 [Polyangiaceae bacterium]
MPRIAHARAVAARGAGVSPRCASLGSGGGGSAAGGARGSTPDGRAERDQGGEGGDEESEAGAGGQAEAGHAAFYVGLRPSLPPPREARVACAEFPDGGPAEDRGTRLDQLDALGERRRDAWTRLDSLFEGASSSSAVAAYVRANAMAFGVR